MGTDDNIRNKAQDVSGQAKEKLGEATGNEDLRDEGQQDQGSAKAKEAVAGAKDKANEAINKIKGSMKRD
ncbi:CsbD family protein [Embleya scabrispora]|uniref:CsbD family protein n=1 Tax=Embleya scabrispora TaxID=159449 RepID=UPI00037DBAE4|nr:CsbD family protein [Embleya scabrispora]MYS82891.1 CsbD family protein [Streptomyces sp. SID5474]